MTKTNNKNFIFWKNIWDNKGSGSSSDLLYLDGYEHLKINFNSQQICDRIIEMCDVNPSDISHLFAQQ